MESYNLISFLLCYLAVLVPISDAFFQIASNGKYCQSECSTPTGEGYYYCVTDEYTTGKCSPFKDITYKGVNCRSNHPCDKHGYSYYWCYTIDNSWDYCGITVNVNKKDYVLSQTYNALCIDDCTSRGYSYSWCNTLKGWDYCDPKREIRLDALYLTTRGRRCAGDCKQDGDSFKCDTNAATSGGRKWDYCSKRTEQTISGKKCRTDKPCNKYGYDYYWCWTDSSKNWDYCSPQIDCGYWPTDVESGHSSLHERSKRVGPPNINFCQISDIGNNRQFSFTEDGSGNFVQNPNANLVRNVHEAIGRLDINGINRNEQAGTLVTHGNVRIDFQGYTTNREFANIQVQYNIPRPSGQSTTFAQLFIPTGQDLPSRYIRRALHHSADNRMIVRICVNDMQCGTSSRHH